MLSRAEFETELVPLRAALEMRRRKYLCYYYVGLGMAVLLLATAIFCPEAILGSIENLFRMHVPLATSDIIAYRLFAVLCSCCLVLTPVFGYRGQHRLSIARAVYSRVLSLLGTFNSVPGGGTSVADIRRVGLFTSSLLFYPEEGAIGEMNDVRVKITDALLFKRENARDMLVFKGVLILCELPPDGPEVNKMTALSHTKLLHESLKTLSLTAKELPKKIVRWDEKLTYASAALYARFKDAALSRMGKDELPAEKAYRLKYIIPPLFARADPPRAENMLCELYAHEYSDSASLTAIAGHSALFTLGSLFRLPLDDAHIDRLYDTMCIVDSLTRHLKSSTQPL